MKKINQILGLVLTCCVVFAFTSCQKDGMYKPKEKITQISLQTNGGPTEVVEQWTWEKGLLTQINYVDDGDVATFTYNGKQVSEITTKSGQKMTFAYDGKFVTGCTITSDGEMVAEYTFTHNDDNLISGIEAKFSTDFDLKTSRLIKMLNRIITPGIAEQQNSFYLKEKGVYTMTQTFTYEKSNIISSNTKYSTGGVYDATYTYYTDYMNPFYHLLSYFTDGFSKNALSESVTTNNIISTQVDKLKVTYPTVNGKYPTQATYSYSTEHHIGDLNNTYQNDIDNYFYEYK